MRKTVLANVFVCSAALFLFSCKKSDSTPVIKKSLIAKRTIADNGTFTYSYNSNNLMQSERFVSFNEANAPSYTLTFIDYDAGGRLESASFDFDAAGRQDFVEVYDYDNSGRLIVKGRGDMNGNILELTEFDYDGNTIFEFIENASGMQIRRGEYKLSSDRKNVVEYKQFPSQSGTPSLTITYSAFDDKPNYMSSMPYGLVPFKNQNNVGSRIISNAGTQATTTYTYTYNENQDVFRIIASDGKNVEAEHRLID
jgi:hypothetical protein